MNTSPIFPARRRAASPYARRLAREQGIDLADLLGTGPGNRILAADVMAWRAPVVARASTAPEPAPTAVAARSAPMGFGARVPVAGVLELISSMARAGVEIEIDDITLRAARHALKGLAKAIAIELADRQVALDIAPGLSVGAERRHRLDRTSQEASPLTAPAALSLLVLRSCRAVPLSLPLLPGSILRLVLVWDSTRDHAEVLLCADAEAVTPGEAIAALDAFVAAFDQPLALLA